MYIPIDTDLQSTSQSLKDETACEMTVAPSGTSRRVFVFSLVITWQYDTQNIRV